MASVMTRLLGTTLTQAPAAVLLLAGTIVAMPGTASSAPADATRPDRVRLTAPAGEEVRSATVDLTDRTWSNARGDARTTTLRTSRFSMVGATWRGDEPRLEVRTLRPGGWTAWQHADPMADGPSIRNGGATDLLWVDDSSAIQVRTDGPTPARLDLVLIDPGRVPTDDDPAPDPVRPLRDRATRPTHAPQPELRGRNDWDADPDWRNGKPHYMDHLKQIHVHHTATGNEYSRSDVPAILRGMYRYHTQTLGWFDIGYNFLVDRFGRAWVGRSGGANKLVRGAHTLGFNHASVGIAVIGNLEDRKPWADAVTTVVKLAAWKLDKYGRNASGRVTVRSTGSDKYAEDERVRLPVIDGHRDTNDTACPGERLYAQLPGIRRRAQWRIDHW
jgi:uncharacterized protein with LGFP repeats